jgi:capsular polysaccharide biosynthesis protein
MELRQYWNVIWKRRWLVLAIVLLTALVSVVMLLTTHQTYEAQIRFITRQAPESQGAQPSSLFLYQPDGPWIGSEFLVDDYTEIVKSDAFASAVNEAIGGGMNVPLIKAYIDADRKNRELRLIITGRTTDETRALAAGAAKVLTEVRLKPISGTLVDDKPVFAQIDGADSLTSSRSKDILNAVIRFVIGLAVALVLAFFLEYLDNSVRDEQDARKVLDLPVLGTIPRS